MSLLETAALFGGLSVFNLITLLPLLFFTSIRRLFNALPAENPALNYLIGVGGFTVLHSILLLTVVVARGSLEGIEVLWGLGAINVGIGLLGWIAASVFFPSLDWWSPKKDEDELDGRIALGLGLIWYTVNTGIALFLLIVTMIAFFFPG